MLAHHDKRTIIKSKTAMTIEASYSISEYPKQRTGKAPSTRRKYQTKNVNKINRLMDFLLPESACLQWKVTTEIGFRFSDIYLDHAE